MATAQTPTYHWGDILIITGPEGLTELAQIGLRPG